MALTKRDFQGDGLITYDSTTNLEWLNLILTRGLSYDDVSSLLNPAGKFAGWSYATFDEIRDFYRNFGIDNLYMTSDEPAFVASWNQLVSYIGDISVYDNNSQKSQFYGVCAGSANAQNWVSYTINQLIGSPPSAGHTRFENQELMSSDKLPYMASFLVRPALAAQPAAPTLRVGN